MTQPLLLVAAQFWAGFAEPRPEEAVDVLGATSQLQER